MFLLIVQHGYEVLVQPLICYTPLLFLWLSKLWWQQFCSRPNQHFCIMFYNSSFQSTTTSTRKTQPSKTCTTWVIKLFNILGHDFWALNAISSYTFNSISGCAIRFHTICACLVCKVQTKENPPTCNRWLFRQLHLSWSRVVTITIHWQCSALLITLAAHFCVECLVGLDTDTDLR